MAARRPSNPSPKPKAEPAASPIDRLMDRASVALEETRYFDTESLATTALGRAHRAHDYERMARIVLPLQEARRQKRQLAIDAAHLGPSAPGITVIDSRRQIPAPADVPAVGGCFVFQPPLIAADARDFHDAANAAKVPVMVLTREPLTRDGLWPIVSVSPSHSVRTKIAPPTPQQRDEASKTKDGFTAASAGQITRPWLEAALEALGDAAIAKIKTFETQGDPPAWLVEDYLEQIEAFPDHEKLHQELARVCRLAMHAPAPTQPRRRGLAGDSPFSF
jgi:hypothetical protein